MFNITQAMLLSWKNHPRPKATPNDVATLEAATGAKLPAHYAEFVAHHGFVFFGYDEEQRWQFSYTLAEPGQQEIRQSVISYLFDPAKMLKIYRYMISTDDPADETRPMMPPGYLPVGSDLGHGSIMLELENNPGRVWYWRESDWRWGTHDNTALGYVAENFEEFINGLRPDPL